MKDWKDGRFRTIAEAVLAELEAGRISAEHVLALLEKPDIAFRGLDEIELIALSAQNPHIVLSATACATLAILTGEDCWVERLRYHLHAAPHHLKTDVQKRLLTVLLYQTQFDQAGKLVTQIDNRVLMAVAYTQLFQATKNDLFVQRARTIVDGISDRKEKRFTLLRMVKYTASCDDAVRAIEAFTPRGTKDDLSSLAHQRIVAEILWRAGQLEEAAQTILAIPDEASLVSCLGEFIVKTGDISHIDLLKKRSLGHDLKPLMVGYVTRALIGSSLTSALIYAKSVSTALSKCIAYAVIAQSAEPLQYMNWSFEYLSQIPLTVGGALDAAKKQVVHAQATHGLREDALQIALSIREIESRCLALATLYQVTRGQPPFTSFKD